MIKQKQDAESVGFPMPPLPFQNDLNDAPAGGGAPAMDGQPFPPRPGLGPPPLPIPGQPPAPFPPVPPGG